VKQPQINVFCDADEHVNIIGRRAMSRLMPAVNMRLEPTRFHHSRVFRNPLARMLMIDDGYYFFRSDRAARDSP